jgi:small GTP-binding protein
MLPRAIANPILQVRVVIIGDSTVGKTSMLNRLTANQFNKFETPTIVSNFQVYRRTVESTTIELQIWDTAGQEKFRSLAPIYYRSATAAIVVYDISSRATFDRLQQWIDAFTEIIPQQPIIMVVGNKKDLLERDVPLSEAEEWAQAHVFPICETSALTGDGITELFDGLADAVARSWAAGQRQPEAGPSGGRAKGCVC